jgi:hypothetical protein
VLVEKRRRARGVVEEGRREGGKEAEKGSGGVAKERGWGVSSIQRANEQYN